MTFGMLDLSIDTFRSLLDRDIVRGERINSPIASNLIEALNRAHEYQRAIEIYESLSHLDLSEPTDSLHYNAGNSYLHADRPLDAAHCYVMALRMGDADPRNGDVEKSYVLHNLGICHYKMKDDKTAIMYYMDALNHVVSPADMAYEECSIGDAYYGLGRHEVVPVGWTAQGAG